MFKDLKPYSDYRLTGSPWLGIIPSHWPVRRLKTVLFERVEKGHPEEPLLAATQTRGVIRKDDYDVRTVTALKDLHLLKLVEVGDFVISLRSFQGGIERAHERGIISPAYTILKPKDLGDRDYLTLLFKSRAFVDGLRLCVTGIREGQNIDYSRLARDLVPHPPESEQAAIVRYLAHANRRIDHAIAAKRKLIRLLEEQKQVSINHAVTRGLDPNVSMKDSGVAWLGDIPSHWDSIRTRFLLREVDLRSLDGFEDPLAMSQKLGLVPADQVERTLSSRSNVGAKLCQPGDLVLNRLKAHLGVFAIAHDSGLVSPDYSVFRLRAEGIPGYYELLLKCNSIRAELRRRTKGIVEGFWRLYTDDFFDIRLPIPPVSEQAEILSWALGETRETTRTVASLEHEISLLREFRTRLTSDAVTGQVDVREIAASLPEVAPYELADVVEGSMDDELDELAEESTKHGALV